jgi:hypothetical protein
VDDIDPMWMAAAAGGRGADQVQLVLGPSTRTTQVRR